jgi:predicted small secreted protein
MKTRKLSLWAVLLCTVFSGVALTACNTVEGIGRDVEAAGDAIEDAAD